MHVAVVTTSYPDGRPGSEAAGAFVADFAHELGKLVRVTVLAASQSNSVTEEGSVQVRRFAVPRLPLSLLNPLKPGDWLSILRTVRSGRDALNDLAKNDAPDMIFALWALPSGHWARSVGERRGIPYAIWALGSDIWALGKLPLLRRHLGSVLGSAAVCFADGLKLARDVESLSGGTCRFLPSSRALTSAPGTATALAAPYKIAFLGRWHRNKGIDLFLESLEALSEADWSQIAKVRIYGGGPLEAQVHESVRDLQSNGRPVELGGYLDRNGAMELISWSDYLALPSRIESIPVIFSDAAQMRRPIIATPVGDLPELFEKRAFGVLAADATASAYRDALRSALALDASQFGPALEAFAAEFDVAATARQFLQDVGGEVR